jgi:hypothetical protein
MKARGHIKITAPTSTERQLVNGIKEVQIACLGGQIMARTFACTGSVGGHPAVVAAYVTCPDPLANTMKGAIAATIERVFSEANLHITKDPAPV